MTDPVDHPAHYTAHPSGVECIQITEHMGFNLGNALKYIWRADLKGNAVEDLRKARWYLDRELSRRAGSAAALDPVAGDLCCTLGEDTDGRRHLPGCPAGVPR